MLYLEKKTRLTRAEWTRHEIKGTIFNSNKLRAAYDWLYEHNATYKKWVQRQNAALRAMQATGVYQYWLPHHEVFLHCHGIEVAAWPVLYARTCFGDTNHRQVGLVADTERERETFMEPFNAE